jgi:hypothetical protein
MFAANEEFAGISCAYVIVSQYVLVVNTAMV